jgi:hypothetical protein
MLVGGRDHARRTVPPGLPPYPAACRLEEII